MTTTATRVQALEALCAELYQVLGTVGAPTAVLDKVWAAADGQPIPRVDLLPIGEDAFEAVRERQAMIDAVTALVAPRRSALIGQAGGRRTSPLKSAAARANGRKGGRPRKGTPA
jgi:hypothetical protein